VRRRGFTDHEHLDRHALIHMNGRMYDYRLGRFLGVDPILQFPTNSQSLNPYSYILNNPLSGTDPTGYESCDVGADKSCLEDGVNTVTKDGKTVGTVIVGNAGDELTFSGGGASVSGVIGKGGNGASFLGGLAKDASSIGGIASRISGSFEARAATLAANDVGPARASPLALSNRVAAGASQSSYCDSFACDLSNHTGRVLKDMVPGAGVYQGFQDWQQGNYGSAAFNTLSDLPLGKAAKGIGAGAGVLLPLIRGSSDTLRSFTSANFRENLGRLTGSIPFGSQAHHVFPQKFAERFEKLGINVHDPRFGAWWDAVEHGAHSRAYNDVWQGFFQGNPTQQGALDLARDLSSRYGYGVNF